MNERKEATESGLEGLRNRQVRLKLFAKLLLLIAGAWAAYFWGVATGNYVSRANPMPLDQELQKGTLCRIGILGVG
jgi:hypothetical protein